jgi:hypothetical protein
VISNVGICGIGVDETMDDNDEGGGDDTVDADAVVCDSVVVGVAVVVGVDVVVGVAVAVVVGVIGGMIGAAEFILSCDIDKVPGWYIDTEIQDILVNVMSVRTCYPSTNDKHQTSHSPI